MRLLLRSDSSCGPVGLCSSLRHHTPRTVTRGCAHGAFGRGLRSMEKRRRASPRRWAVPRESACGFVQPRTPGSEGQVPRAGEARRRWGKRTCKRSTRPGGAGGEPAPGTRSSHASCRGGLVVTALRSARGPLRTRPPVGLAGFRFGTSHEQDSWAAASRAQPVGRERAGELGAPRPPCHPLCVALQRPSCDRPARICSLRRRFPQPRQALTCGLHSPGPFTFRAWASETALFLPRGPLDGTFTHGCSKGSAGDGGGGVRAWVWKGASHMTSPGWPSVSPKFSSHLSVRLCGPGEKKYVSDKFEGQIKLWNVKCRFCKNKNKTLQLVKCSCFHDRQPRMKRSCLSGASAAHAACAMDSNQVPC